MAKYIMYNLATGETVYADTLIPQDLLGQYPTGRYKSAAIGPFSLEFILQDPPVNTSLPTFSGIPIVGQTLSTTSNGTWSNVVDSYVKAWLRSGTPIAGATGDSYQLQEADNGALIRLRVTAINSTAAVSAESVGVNVTYAAPVASGIAAQIQYNVGIGNQTVNSSVYFTVPGDVDRSSLSYSLAAAVSGFSVDSVTGALTVPTTSPLTNQLVTVVATNSGGSDNQDFSVTIVTPLPAYNPTAVIADGAAALTYSNKAQTNSQQFAFWANLIDTDDLPSIQNHGLFSVWGRFDIWIDMNGKLNITAERAVDSYIYRWQSNASIKAAGVSRLHYKTNLATETFAVKINEATVAGTFLEGDPASANWTAENFIFNRNAFAFLAISQGTNGAVSDIARDLSVRSMAVWFGATNEATDFYSGGTYVDPLTVGSPLAVFDGNAASFNGGVNRVTGGIGNAVKQGNFFNTGAIPNAPVLITPYTPGPLTVGVAMPEVELKVFVLGYGIVATEDNVPPWMTVTGTSISPGGTDVPTATGTAIPVRIDITNGGGTLNFDFTIDVVAAATAPSYLGTFSTQTVPWGVAGNYSTVEHFGGTPPFTFTMSGAPTGVTINSISGLISWVDSVAAGAYSLTVTATNSQGSSNGTVTLRIGLVGQTTASITPGTGANSINLPVGLIADDWVEAHLACGTGVGGGGLSWVVFDGTDSIRFASSLGSDNISATVAVAIRNVGGAGTERCIHDLTGRGDITISTGDNIRVRAYNTTNTLLIDWNSNNQINVSAAGNHSLVVHYNPTGDGTGVAVYWDGALVTGGQYNTGPLSGTIDWTRNGNGIGSTHDGLAQFLIAELAEFYLRIGSIVAASNFYSGGQPVVYTGGTPNILFHGAATAWQAGTNLGSAISTWTAVGTFTNGAGGGGTFTAPAGYTELYAGTGSAPFARSYGKFMGAVPDTTISISKNATQKTAVVIQAWRGVNKTSPLDVTTPAAVVDGTNQATINPPAVTTSTDKAMVRAVGFLDDDDAASSVTAPTGYGGLLAADTGDNQTDGTGATVMVASKIVLTPAVENPSTFGHGKSDTSHGITICLRSFTYGGAPGDTVLPTARVGFGASTTGGENATESDIIFITNTNGDSSNGSYRWALAQAALRSSAVIIPLVEGRCHLTGSVADLTAHNVTFDNRWSPGHKFMLSGERVEFLGNNFERLHGIHLGHRDSYAGNADTSKRGREGSEFSTDICVRHYEANCYEQGGRDENWTIHMRTNGWSTGAKMQNITYIDGIVTRPMGQTDPEPPHAFNLFFGDGTERLTFARSMMSESSGRNPYARDFSNQIEYFNNVHYNNAGGGAIKDPSFSNWNGDIQASIRGCVYITGPYWLDLKPFCTTDTGSRPNIYFNDNLVIETGGTVYSESKVYDSGTTPASSQPFTGSGITVMAASATRAYVNANAGPREYGGVVWSRAAQKLANMMAGNTPTGSPPIGVAEAYPALAGAPSAATLLDSNMIPLAYKARYPAATNLTQVIQDGSPWNGMKQWRRIGAWFVNAAYST